MSVVPYQQKLNASAIESLPQDLLKEVLSYSSNKDIEKKIMQVNKYFLNYVENQGLLNDYYMRFASYIFPIVRFDDNDYLLTGVEAEEKALEKYEAMNEICIGRKSLYGYVYNLTKSQDKIFSTDLVGDSRSHDERYNSVCVRGCCCGFVQYSRPYRINYRLAALNSSTVTKKDLYSLARSIYCNDRAKIQKFYARLLQSSEKINDGVSERLIELKPVINLMTESSYFSYLLDPQHCILLLKNFVRIKSFACWSIQKIDGYFEPKFACFVKRLCLHISVGLYMVPVFVWLCGLGYSLAQLT